jgi:signal transduction histidine kinase
MVVTDQNHLEHALKNCIAIILGYADLLLEELPADDPRLDDLREIQKAATAATVLINNYQSTST